MTLRELSRYLKLKDRLERAEQLLEALQSAACPGAQVITGMPHGTGVKDRIGDLTAEITDLQSKIENLIPRVAAAETKVLAFIDTVEDEQMHVILRLRFVRCLTWQETADVIGGNNTADGVKTACYRFLSNKKLQRRDAP